MDCVVRKKGLIPAVYMVGVSLSWEINFQEHLVDPLSAINITLSIIKVAKKIMVKNHIIFRISDS